MFTAGSLRTPLFYLVERNSSMRGEGRLQKCPQEETVSPGSQELGSICDETAARAEWITSVP